VIQAGGWARLIHRNHRKSAQIDIAAARKGTRFIRFCNLYNIPMIFIEDTTGFLPGVSQEHNGIVLEGRRFLDSIIDIRTPRLTLIIRNAFGGVRLEVPGRASFGAVYCVEH